MNSFILFIFLVCSILFLACINVSLIPVSFFFKVDEIRPVNAPDVVSCDIIETPACIALITMAVLSTP